MRIEVKGRNVAVGDDLREHIEKRFAKVSKQVPELATLEVELIEEKNPKRAKESQIAEVTLRLKRKQLRAHEASPSMTQSINKTAEELARQVKRLKEKRQRRREGAAAKMQAGPSEQPAAP